MPKIDLTNKQFEHFKVIDRNEEHTKENGRNVFWNCICECGNSFIETTTRINKGQRKSCGCLSAQITSKYHLQDLTGQVFGELTVLERDFNHPQNGKKQRTYWKCQCSCGNIISVGRDHLIGRGQSSCGCKISIGELHINQLLNNNHIKYKTQYTNQNLKTINNGYLKYDFAILDNNNNIVRLVEFDGPQHKKYDNYFDNFEKLQERDQQKNLYAKEQNIPLVRIPYYKRDCITLDDLMGDQFLV